MIVGLRFSCGSAYVQGRSFRLGEKNQKPPGGHNGGCGPRTPVYFSGWLGSKPSRGDLHSRVGGAGSAPPHDRCPTRWVMQTLLYRVAALLLSAVTPVKGKPIFQYERWVSKG